MFAARKSLPAGGEAGVGDCAAKLAAAQPNINKANTSLEMFFMGDRNNGKRIGGIGGLIKHRSNLKSGAENRRKTGTCHVFVLGLAGNTLLIKSKGPGQVNDRGVRGVCLLDLFLGAGGTLAAVTATACDAVALARITATTTCPRFARGIRVGDGCAGEKQARGCN